MPPAMQLLSFHPSIHLSIYQHLSLPFNVDENKFFFFFQISITQLQMMTQENITSEQKTEVFISTP